MKITCSKRDETLRQKQEYELKKAEKQSQYDAQYKSYSDAVNTQDTEIINQVKSAIGSTQLDLDIRVSDRYGSGLEVTVRDEGHLHDDGKSISWRWSAMVNKEKGQVIKDSSSWSGLRAVSVENLADLKEIVRVLEVLNTLDWSSILNVDRPDYMDYVNMPNPRYEKGPDFDRMLIDADIEEVIGERILIAGKPVRSWGSTNRSWYGIIKDTPKQYVIFTVFDYNIRNVTENGQALSDIVEKNSRYTQRISKDKFIDMIEMPIQTMTY